MEVSNEVQIELELISEDAITPGKYPESNEDCFVIRAAALVSAEQLAKIISIKGENHTYKAIIKK